MNYFNEKGIFDQEQLNIQIQNFYWRKKWKLRNFRNVFLISARIDFLPQKFTKKILIQFQFFLLIFHIWKKFLSKISSKILKVKIIINKKKSIFIFFITFVTINLITHIIFEITFQRRRKKMCKKNHKELCTVSFTCLVSFCV